MATKRDVKAEEIQVKGNQIFSPVRGKWLHLTPEERVQQEYLNRESIENLEVPLPPLEIQKQLIEKVMVQRKVVSELKFEAEERSVKVKKDVEAMILGSKSVPKAV